VVTEVSAPTVVTVVTVASAPTVVTAPMVTATVVTAARGRAHPAAGPAHVAACVRMAAVPAGRALPPAPEPTATVVRAPVVRVPAVRARAR
jgi:hypothetical protein